MIHILGLAFLAEGLTAAEKVQLICLANHADAHGYAYPSVATLAFESAMSERTVVRSIASLVEKKLITKRFRRGVGGRSTSNLYRVEVRALEAIRRPPRDFGGNFVEDMTVEGVAPESELSTGVNQPGRHGDTPNGGEGDTVAPPPCHPVTPTPDTVAPLEPSLEPSKKKPGFASAREPDPGEDQPREDRGEIPEDPNQVTAYAIVDVLPKLAIEMSPMERDQLAVEIAERLAAGWTSPTLIDHLTANLGAEARHWKIFQWRLAQLPERAAAGLRVDRRQKCVIHQGQWADPCGLCRSETIAREPQPEPRTYPRPEPRRYATGPTPNPTKHPGVYTSQWASEAP